MPVDSLKKQEKQDPRGGPAREDFCAGRGRKHIAAYLDLRVRGRRLQFEPENLSSNVSYFTHNGGGAL